MIFAILGSRSRLLTLVTAALSILLDQASKLLVFLTIPLCSPPSIALLAAPKYHFTLVDGFLWIVHLENRRISFGAASGLSQQAQAFFALILPALFLAGLAAVYFLISRLFTRFQAVMIGLLLGGAIGNDIDRLVHAGRVVDFLYPVFLQGRVSRFFVPNLADLFVAVAAPLFLVSLIVMLSRKGSEGRA